MLLPKANDMFPEGRGRVMTFPKDGTAAEKTNELLVNAKAAVDELWKQRGYMNAKGKLLMRPHEIKTKLGYALDREEATGYLVTGAMHFPLLSPVEARTIGKRVGSIVGPLNATLKDMRKRKQSAAVLLRTGAALSLAPPPRKSTALPTPPEQPPPEQPPPEPPPPPSVPLPLPERTSEPGFVREGGDVELDIALSKEAARAIWIAYQVRNLERDAGDPYYDGELEMARVAFKHAVRRLKLAFPSLGCGMSEHDARWIVRWTVYLHAAGERIPAAEASAQKVGFDLASAAADYHRKRMAQPQDV